MLKLRACVAALLLLASSASSSVSAAPAAPIATRTLANGLKVVVVEDHASPVVQTAMWYRFGAENETSGKTGLAHALEHMMFRGTPSISSAGLDEISARLGAELNANTANDYTHFYFVLPADRLDLALRIEADRMRNLTLSEKDWQLEKGAVLAEYDGDLSQPLIKLYDAVCRAATTARLCGLSPLGERSDIVHATAADLRRYYDTYYAPNDATLVITGDVDAENAFSLAQRAFGGIESAKTFNVRAGTPFESKAVYSTGKTVAVSADFPFEVVDLAYPVPGSQDPGFAALQIADSVITNQRSQFYRALVLSGLLMGYQTSYDNNVHDGLYHVFLTVNPKHTAAQARAAFEQTLNDMESRGFPSDLVSAAKTAVGANAVYARDSIAGLGDRVGYALGVEGISDPAQDDKKIQAVTSAEIGAAVKRFLAAPAAIGTLTPRAHEPGQLVSPPSDGVSDTFSNRVPSGPVILAPWAKAELARPLTLRSKINPTRFTLSNGVRVLVQEIHTNPTVFVAGRIENSPRFDPPGKTGTEALASTLLSYGSEKYDFSAQRKISDDLAASLEVGQTFGAHGMAKDLGTLLDVLADGEEHPTFPQEYVELVRRQTLAAIARRKSDPDYLASRAFDQLLLAPTDPALREADEASVNAITTKDLQSYIRNYARPDLATISVVGDVTPEEVRSKLEASFGSWKANGPTPETSEQAIPVPKPATAHILTERPQVSIKLGQPAPSRRDPDFYAMNVMNGILGGGGGFDTRLMNEIRTKRGLVYSVASTLDVDRYRGILSFDLSAAPKNALPAVQLLVHELRRLQSEPVSSEELSRTETKIVASALVSEQSTDVILAHVQNIGISDLPADYYRTLSSRYDTISIADVQRAARSHLLPDHLVEIFEGPKP